MSRVAQIGTKLSRTSEHRRALLRNLATSLINHERIETTLPKAKKVQPIAEKLVGLAKDGSLQARRKASSYLFTKEAVSKLFGEMSKRYESRAGGYTRVVRTRERQGDNATMAFIEFVDRPGELRPAKIPKEKLDKAFAES